jgi:hypothetical protein
MATSTFSALGIGLLAFLSADCLSDPIMGDPILMCTQADLPNCDGIVRGRHPNCVCDETVVLPPDTPGDDGDGRLSLEAASGWSLSSVDGGIPELALVSVDENGDPTSSDPLALFDIEKSGWTADFSFEQPNIGVMAVWDGPASVTMTNPQGETVSKALPASIVLPLQAFDDCSTLKFSGSASSGPLSVELDASLTSLGCD